MGTFGSDRITAKEIAGAVKEAIALGYRHIDCASVYGNEAEIGRVLREVLSSGLVKTRRLVDHFKALERQTWGGGCSGLLRAVFERFAA